MNDFLPRNILDALHAGQERAVGARRSRLAVEADGKRFPVLRVWSDGFALSGQAPRLRGLVELRDGARLVRRCLIVTAAEEAGETRYDFKRLSEHVGAQPVDYERAQDAPAAYLMPPPDSGLV